MKKIPNEKIKSSPEVFSNRRTISRSKLSRRYRCDIIVATIPLQQYRYNNTGTRRSELSLRWALPTTAFWQLRINDLIACIAKTHLPARPALSFNLTLSDPISKYLEPDQKWQGIAGEYSVHLGTTSEAKPGLQKSLPELKTSVSAFSRLWLGAASANAIATADDLQASQTLLDQLDETFCLPLPKVGWEF